MPVIKTRAKKARRYGAPCLGHVARLPLKVPKFQSKQLVRAKRRNVNSVAHPRRAHSVTKIPPPSRPNPRKTPSANLSVSLFAPRSLSPRPLPHSEARYSASHMGRLRPQNKKGPPREGRPNNKDSSNIAPHINTTSKARHSECAIHRKPHAVRMGSARASLEGKVKEPWRGSRGRGDSSAPRKRSRGRPRRRCGRDP